MHVPGMKLKWADPGLQNSGYWWGISSQKFFLKPSTFLENPDILGGRDQELGVKLPPGFSSPRKAEREARILRQAVCLDVTLRGQYKVLVNTLLLWSARV